MYLANDLFVNDSDVFVQHLSQRKHSSVDYVHADKICWNETFHISIICTFQFKIVEMGLVGLGTSTPKYGTLEYWIL